MIADENFCAAEDEGKRVGTPKHDTKAVILSTGGYGRLFEGETLFDAFIPELPLIGLRRALELSRNSA
jgi:aspartate oxidase